METTQTEKEIRELRQYKLRLYIDLQVNLAVKKEIREMQEEFRYSKKELLQDLREQIYKTINLLGREFMEEELRKIDIPQTLADKFNKLLSLNMRPIIKEAFIYVNVKQRKTILNTLIRLYNLKTSDIEEVKEAVQKNIITENDILTYSSDLKKLENEHKKLNHSH